MPSMTKDEGVYPGWTLAVINITFLFYKGYLKFVMVSMSRLLPILIEYYLPMLCRSIFASLFVHVFIPTQIVVYRVDYTCMAGNRRNTSHHYCAKTNSRNSDSTYSSDQP